MKTSAAGVLYCLLLLLAAPETGGAAEKEGTSRITEAAAYAEYGAIAERLGIEVSPGFFSRGVVTAHSMYHDGMERVPLWSIGSGSPFEVRLEPDTGRVRQVFCWQTEARAGPVGSASSVHTDTQIVEEAVGNVRKILQILPSGAGRPRITRISPGGSRPWGRLIVSWSREVNGILWRKESVSVCVRADDLGFVSLTDARFDREYDEPRVTLSAEKAAQAADRCLDAYMAKLWFADLPGAGTWRRQRELLGLVMDMPNDVFSGRKGVPVRPPRARAVYPFRYSFVDPKGNTMVALQIWVDAETGSIAGGVI